MHLEFFINIGQVSAHVIDRLENLLNMARNFEENLSGTIAAL